MSTSAIDVPPKGGFSFDLCRRNDMLAKKGLKSPSYLKTGTTIVGLIFQFSGIGLFWLPLIHQPTMKYGVVNQH
ncbi:proteasome subunit beta type-7-A [Cucumis melo var. makuwa]|uniref:Proteasome subunit beta type-7-A n=1 Tax=Cucumis melo var. makuwa TaxID=1194695 RepID=A0A5A7TV24_CUCMM|nr:proteasome subunit beta type-7-A [Cucumis melo var. makuwa]